MIRKIKLRGVASYSADKFVIVETGKRVNLVYGHNGTGKSTMASFLQAPMDPRFTLCSVEIEGEEPEVFVYNQRFITENFYDKPSQPGIFTLNKGNAEAEKAIHDAEEAIRGFEVRHKSIIEDGKKLKRDLEQKQLEIKEKVWEAKFKFERTELEFCLDGVKGSKDKFLSKILDTVIEDEIESETKLRADAKELQGQADKEKDVPDRIEANLSELESDPVWKEVIVGSGDSYLAGLIKKLENSDWVSRGQKFLLESDEVCPFCQQALPHNFSHDLGALFDSSYKERINHINGLLSGYKQNKQEILLKLGNSSFQDEYFKDDGKFQLSKRVLIERLDRNIDEIEKKILNPSAPVNLEESSSLLEDLNRAIEDTNSRINLFNERIKNKKKFLSEISRKFWVMLRGQFEAAISLNKKEVEKIEIDLGLKREDLRGVRADIDAARSKISESQEKITNIEQSIESINSTMKMLGLTGFYIDKAGDEKNFYKLSRDGGGKDIYKSLSEGEKTLITFLYFLECCKGAASKEKPVVSSNRIVVIDDPISSLSHNYVFDIAALIYRRIIDQDFRQIFIFTHNLFFFHEILRLRSQSNECPPDFKLHRVFKADFSEVDGMARNEIQNDYQSYWNLVRDALEGRVPSAVLPNVMRNILEYYFNFVHQRERLNKALAEISSEQLDFKPLERYINRGSHSDAINISDFGEIDPNRYVEMFRMVFYKTGFEDHFEKMMRLRGAVGVN